MRHGYTPLYTSTQTVGKVGKVIVGYSKVIVGYSR